MSERQVKRVRALEGRNETLEGRVGMLEAGWSVREDKLQEEARRAALSARLRERDTRRREYIWRNLALAAVLAALIVCVAATLAVRSRETGAAEPETEAVVCRRPVDVESREQIEELMQ